MFDIPSIIFWARRRDTTKRPFMGGHQVTGTTSMEENIQEIIFEVEGIICTGCAMDMETVILNTDGIEEASVNYADGTFTIKYDTDEIDAQDVFEKVKKLGFKTKILSGGA